MAKRQYESEVGKMVEDFTKEVKAPPTPKPKPTVKSKAKKVEEKPKGKVGHPKKDDPSEKRQQIALTLNPQTISRLQSVGSRYRVALSRYIDNNLDSIIKEIETIHKYL